MRLIDSDALMERMKEIYTDADQRTLYSEIWRVVSHAPAIDAVRVVRCKNCKHYYAEQGSCDLHDERGPDGEIEHRFYVTPDWFCANGKWREE